MEPIARKATLTDLDDMLSLYETLHDADDPLASRERLEEIWKATLENEILYPLVLEYKGRCIATCILTIVPNLTRGGRPYMLIENVVVAPEHRRSGIGKQLMAEAKKIADSKDCYKLMLLSGSSNVSAHSFYENIGFDRNRKIGFEIRK